MLRLGSCMYWLMCWLSLVLALCTVSQANCTGGTSSDDMSITSNHRSMPGRELPITSRVRSNQRLYTIHQTLIHLLPQAQQNCTWWIPADTDSWPNLFGLARVYSKNENYQVEFKLKLKVEFKLLLNCNFIIMKLILKKLINELISFNFYQVEVFFFTKELPTISRYNRTKSQFVISKQL